MEANGKRIIFSGKEYDHLFPRPLLRTTTIREDASVEDTVAFMQQMIPRVKGETAKIASLLEASTLEATCRKIWKFLYHHVPYNPDAKGIEQVRSPAMVWWSRDHPGPDGKVGVDCDCYSSFISATLCALGIEHHLRITQYPKEPPEVPYWQHIYVVVPLNQVRGTKLKRRSEYIVIDCVKNRFDDEQPFLIHRDYPMKLEFLSGLEGVSTFRVPGNVDAQDLAAADEFDEMAMLSGWEQDNFDMGTLEGPKLKKFVKKVGKKIGQGIRLINRVANPATIALRNAFLLAMKVNFMKVASKLRYSYLTDAQARERGMNMDKFAKLKKIRQKAEDVYFKAGGKKENLAKAILNGKGNQDRKVPTNQLAGIQDQVYMDESEYSVLSGDFEEEQSLNGLGELVTAASLAAAVPAITAVAVALKAVKGLFAKGGAEAAEFDGEGSAEPVPAEPSVDATTTEEYQPSPSPAPAPAMRPEADRLPAPPPQQEIEVPQADSSQGSASQTTSSASSSGGDGSASTSGGGFFAWIKENPLKATGIGLGIVGVGVLGYYLLKKKPASQSMGSLSGLPKARYKKKKKKYKKRSATPASKHKIQSINLL